MTVVEERAVHALSVVIPAYNEEDAIAAGKLDGVSRWLTVLPMSTELILVDDGSEDDTARLAQDRAARVIRITHSGKASAIMAGIRAAEGRVVLFTDMDQATPITEALKLLQAIDAGADVAIGSRGLVRQGAPLGRYFLSWSQVALRRVLLGLRVSDTQCGFKAFTRSAALHVLEHLRVYRSSRLSPIRRPSVTSGFDIEFLFVAQRLGYRIREVPVAWNYKDTRRVSLLRDGWHGVLDLLRIALADVKAEYPKLGTVARRSEAEE